MDALLAHIGMEIYHWELFMNTGFVFFCGTTYVYRSRGRR
jgi:hypothetical protein